MTDPMPWIDINLIVMAGISLAAFVMLGIFVLIAMKIMRGNRPKQAKGQLPQEDEARMIQEIYQGLNKMDQRVEALEVLLYDREKERES